MDKIEILQKDLKLTQEALLLATQVNAYKTSFLGRISHELRCHLSSLLSLHQLIIADLCEDPAEEREFINQAYKAGCKLMKIIEDISTVSKLEYGSIALNIQPLPARDFFHDLYNLIYLPIHNKHIKLNLIFPSNELVLYTDSKRLLTALVILVETAINHISTGVIDIWVQEKTNQIVVNLSLPLVSEYWLKQDSFPYLKSNFTKEELREFTDKISLSPSLKIELVKNILGSMGGSLDINQAGTKTEIKFLLPLETISYL
ncbi:MAG: Sensor histidine kinase RcsC [Chroococcopsis gigantea SAG 12.99]|jgi:K+-sensing histidine kinase KdpD|nr:HAMP domain-containing histidine kinase [Chlorogloea purpurea SAG 13.99]MDV2998604.1 Sensor histidine kinase RcsC [Chroococcopsis gigantea SAG 12.99]